MNRETQMQTQKVNDDQRNNWYCKVLWYKVVTKTTIYRPYMKSMSLTSSLHRRIIVECSIRCSSVSVFVSHTTKAKLTLRTYQCWTPGIHTTTLPGASPTPWSLTLPTHHQAISAQTTSQQVLAAQYTSSVGPRQHDPRYGRAKPAGFWAYVPHLRHQRLNLCRGGVQRLEAEV